ncbi:MAG: hypothetical protein IT372_42645 [Polyangiaceae bacterium]|nr:hypothetical protein [Polyangiaceae bacterium]
MLDETNNPLVNPGPWDKFKLDSVENPGLSELQSGGERKDKIESMQGAGDEGAFTVFKGSEISSLSYLVKVWSVGQLKQLGAWLELLRSGRKKKPRKVYDHEDPRTAHNEILRTTVESIGPVQKLAPGMWGVVVAFKEWRKKKTTGGPVRGKSEGQTAAEQARDFANQQQAEFEKQLNALQKGG